MNFHVVLREDKSAIIVNPFNATDANKHLILILNDNCGIERVKRVMIVRLFCVIETDHFYLYKVV